MEISTIVMLVVFPLNVSWLHVIQLNLTLVPFQLNILTTVYFVKDYVNSLKLAWTGLYIKKISMAYSNAQSLAYNKIVESLNLSCIRTDARSKKCKM